MVVLLHSQNIALINCDNLIESVQYLISNKLCQIAVPLFFFISGYLFFFKLELRNKFDISFFISNYKKRLKTILLPYVLWCSLWFVFIYGLQYLPVIKNYFPHPLHSLSGIELFKQLFYYPLNYPFWFLRELIVLLLFCPLIFLFVKYLKWVSVLIGFLLTFFSQLIIISDLSVLKSIPFFYFTLGAFVSLNKISIVFNSPKKAVFSLVLFWFFFNLLSFFDDKCHFLMESITRGFNMIKDFLGCIAVWLLYDLLNKKKQWKNYNYYSYSFFIFAFHGLPTLILVKISIVLFENNSFFLFLSYLTIPTIVLFVAIYLGKMINKTNPGIYNVLVGSRK